MKKIKEIKQNIHFHIDNLKDYKGVYKMEFMDNYQDYKDDILESALNIENLTNVLIDQFNKELEYLNNLYKDLEHQYKLLENEYIELLPNK